MTIKDLCKEKSLWRGKPDPMAAMKYKLFSPFTAFLLFGLLPAIPLLMSKHTKAFTMGVMLVVFLIARIVQIIMSYFAAKNTHYCISEKNIYIQTGIDGGEETICRPIEYFHTIEIEELKYNLGNVICGYGKDSGYQSYKLEFLPDYQTAYDLIQQIRDHGGRLHGPLHQWRLCDPPGATRGHLRENEPDGRRAGPAFACGRVLTYNIMCGMVSTVS